MNALLNQARRAIPEASPQLSATDLVIMIGAAWPV